MSQTFLLSFRIFRLTSLKKFWCRLFCCPLDKLQENIPLTGGHVRLPWLHRSWVLPLARRFVSIPWPEVQRILPCTFTSVTWIWNRNELHGINMIWRGSTTILDRAVKMLHWSGPWESFNSANVFSMSCHDVISDGRTLSAISRSLDVPAV